MGEPTTDAVELLGMIATRSALVSAWLRVSV